MNYLLVLFFINDGVNIYFGLVLWFNVILFCNFYYMFYKCIVDMFINVDMFCWCIYLISIFEIICYGKVSSFIDISVCKNDYRVVVI